MIYTLVASLLLSRVTAFVSPNIANNNKISFRLNNAAPSSSSLKMSLSSGFGISTAESTKDAVAEAVDQASKGIGGDASIAFVSCTVSRDVDEVRGEFANALGSATPISGITSSGSILTAGGPKGGAVGCLLLKSDDSNAFATAYDKEDAKAAATSLKGKMAEPQDILMSSTPGAEEGIIETLAEIFPNVPVFGGTAADDELSGAWKVMDRVEVSGTGISLVGISTSVKFGASMLGPYTPTSTKVIATKTDGRRIFEINDKPAADWVFQWLGDDVKEQYENGGLILPATAQKPIALRKPSGEYITCHCAAFGGEEKFVDFFAPIPEGSELIVMDSGDGPSTGYATALENAYDTAKDSFTMSSSDPTAGLLVYCGGMAIAVGDNLGTGLTSDKFVSKVSTLPMLGMTCFGEQAYLDKEKCNVQRNLSVGMILLG